MDQFGNRPVHHIPRFFDLFEFLLIFRLTFLFLRITSFFEKAQFEVYEVHLLFLELVLILLINAVLERFKYRPMHRNRSKKSVSSHHTLVQF